MNTVRHQRPVSMLMRISLLYFCWDYVYIQLLHFPLLLPLPFLSFSSGGSNPKMWSWSHYRKCCKRLLLPEVGIFSGLSANLRGRLSVFMKQLPVDLHTNHWIQPIPRHMICHSGWTHLQSRPLQWFRKQQQTGDLCLIYKMMWAGVRWKETDGKGGKWRPLPLALLGETWVYPDALT